MKTEKTYKMPFQYGYSSCYIDTGFKTLQDNNIINERGNWQYCRDNNIILRTNLKEKCLKRELEI